MAPLSQCLLFPILLVLPVRLKLTDGFVLNHGSSSSSCCRSLQESRLHNSLPLGKRSFALHMSLKPAAIPMMDSGKALARSGELLVDLTTELGLYGGALSAAGAQIRNAGDSIAQAAASCRFKTAAELVCDELREGATCLEEATGKMRQAVEEAEQDQDATLKNAIAGGINHVEACSKNLEAAGAGIMQKKDISDIGSSLIACGESLKQFSSSIQFLAPDCREAQESSQRMVYASERMIMAGNELQGKVERPKGKAWLKN